MATLGAVLALTAGALVIVSVAGLVLAGLVRVTERLESNPDRPAMPSHYTSLLHTDASASRGYCTECGTTNEPAFDVCENCSAPLAARPHGDPDWDAEDVFGL